MGNRRDSDGTSKKRDWVQILLAPLLLAIVGAALAAWFNAQQTERQNAIEDRRAEAVRGVEEQRAQDAALQAYLDQMSALVLASGLHNLDGDQPTLYSAPRGDVQYTKASTLARARTLSILDRVDPERKRTVMQTLYESALIGHDDPLQ